ncbi:hypothetical protein [Bradyrhizobium sp. USDA 4350]
MTDNVVTLPVVRIERPGQFPPATVFLCRTLEGDDRNVFVALTRAAAERWKAGSWFREYTELPTAPPPSGDTIGTD